MAVFAVVDEAGFQRRLDARDDGLVDVALALFAPFDLGLEVEQLLPVDDRQAPLFRLRRIDQHAFHVHSFARQRRLMRTAAPAHTVAARVVGSGLRCTRNASRNRKESPWTAVARPGEGAWRKSVGACAGVGPDEQESAASAAMRRASPARADGQRERAAGDRTAARRGRAKTSGGSRWALVAGRVGPQIAAARSATGKPCALGSLARWRWPPRSLPACSPGSWPDRVARRCITDYPPSNRQGPRDCARVSSPDIRPLNSNESITYGGHVVQRIIGVKAAAARKASRDPRCRPGVHRRLAARHRR